MRLSVACALAVSVSVAVLGAALAQGTPPGQRAATATPPSSATGTCPAGTLGVARTLEIDTTGVPAGDRKSTRLNSSH